MVTKKVVADFLQCDNISIKLKTSKNSQYSVLEYIQMWLNYKNKNILMGNSRNNENEGQYMETMTGWYISNNWVLKLSGKFMDINFIIILLKYFWMSINILN